MSRVLARSGALSLIALVACFQVVEAASPSVTAEVRLRAEANDRSFVPDTSAEHGVYQRVRVGLEMDHPDGVNGFVQIQDSRKWGDEGSTTADTENVDLHQAWMEFQAGAENLRVRAGRQELSYGRQRVVGSLGWSNVGRSFDGARLRWTADKARVDVGLMKVSEASAAASGLDENVVFAFVKVEPASNLVLEPFVLYDEIQQGSVFTTALGTWGRWEGGRLILEEDFVYQLGRASGADTKAWLAAVDAYVDVTTGGRKAFLGVGWSQYTGTDASDPEAAPYRQLFPTGHKFHGILDIAQPFVDGLGVGLRDVHAMAKVALPHGAGLKVAFHDFATDTDVMLAQGQDGQDVGQEFSVVLSGKRQGVRFEVGGGVFLPGDLVKDQRGDENALWGYSQATASF